MATELTPPFPDRRSIGRGSPGYRVRKVSRGFGMAWEVTGEVGGDREWVADFNREADARWWAATMEREWDKRPRDHHGN